MFSRVSQSITNSNMHSHTLVATMTNITRCTFRTIIRNGQYAETSGTDDNIALLRTSPMESPHTEKEHSAAYQNMSQVQRCVHSLLSQSPVIRITEMYVSYISSNAMRNFCRHVLLAGKYSMQCDMQFLLN